MNTLIHADIFFFISTICYVLIAAALITAILYLIKLLKSINRIAAKVESNIDTVSEDVKEMVFDIKESGVYRMIFGRPSRSSHRRKE